MAASERFVLRTERVKRNALAAVSQRQASASEPWVVEIKPYRRDRSLAQNRLYWSWLRVIADHIEETGAAQVVDEESGEVSEGAPITPDDVHDWLKAAFLGRKVVRVRGMIRRSARSTTSLTVAEFTDYLERIDMHCAQQLGLILPHPDEYNEAMGREAD